MQRIQKLLIAGVLGVALAGCDGKVPTVADYLHDVDAMRAKLTEANNNPAKYQSDPAAINAGAAGSMLYTDERLWECWEKSKPKSTATTNHACLDAKGFKR